MHDPRSHARRAIARVLFFVATFASAVPGARAFAPQDAAKPAPASNPAEKTPFDPVRELERFEERRASPYRELYPFETYVAQAGAALDAAAHARLKDQWAKDCAAVDAKVATLAQDPSAAQRYVLERRLEKHPYFSKIAYELHLREAAGAPAWLLVLQKPAKEDPALVTRTSDVIAPVIAKLAQVVDERVVKPLGLARRKDAPLCVAVVLATPGDYDNYARASREQSEAYGTCSFDRALGTVVGRNDPFSAKWSLLQDGNFVRVLARAELEAHTDLVPGRRLPWFLSDGLASYLTYTPQSKLDELGKPWLPPLYLRELVDAAQDDALRPALLPLAELLALTGPGSLWTAVQGRAKKLSVDAFQDWRPVGTAFASQGHLWTYFAFDGGDARMREAWRGVLTRAFTGLAPIDGVKSALGADAPQVDALFWRWVFQKADKSLAGVSVDTSNAERVVESFGANPPKPQPKTAGSSTAAGSAPAAKPEPPVELGLFALREDEHDAQLGRALALGRTGDLDGACAKLEELAKKPLDDTTRARVSASIERLRGAITLRAAWLEALRSKGAKMPLTRDGKKLLFTIARVEKDKIVFTEPKNGISELPLSAIDPVELAKEVDQKEERGEAPAVARPFLYALCGDARWEKLAKDDDPAQKALRADATSWMPAVLRAARAADELDALALAGKPAGAEALRAAIERIERIERELASEELVVAREPLLQRFAREVLAAQVQLVPPQDVLCCKSEALGDGRVRLTWLFDDPRELDDVASVPDYEKLVRTWLEEDLRPPPAAAPAEGAPADKEAAPAAPAVPPTGTCAIEKGDLVLSGGVARRVGAPIRAPFTLKVKRRWEERVDGLVPNGSFAMRFCDDLQNRFLEIGGSGRLLVFDGSRGASKEYPGTGDWSFVYGATDEWTITHDGTDVRWSRNGEERGKASCAGMKSGWIVFLVTSLKTTCIESLEIEGALDAGGLAPAREAWIERRMRELGFAKAATPADAAGAAPAAK